MPGIRIGVNRQDKQAIDDLFQHLNQTAAQAGTPDAEADARVRQHIKQGPPTLVYQMAQTLVGQQAALRQLRAQVADLQQQLKHGGRPAGSGQPGWGGGQPGYGGYGAPYQQPYGYQRSGGGGFLAGAGQIALGVGGGILAAEALSDLFGGDGLFGGDRDYSDDRAFDQGYEDGRQDQERYDDNNQYDDQGQYDQGQYDGGGYDGGGGDFGGGGFDDGGGW
jgi:uncharacterized protein